MTFFQEKIPIFTPKISDDRFFLSFSRLSISLLPLMSYMTLSSQEKSIISANNSLMTPCFTLFVLSNASDKHYISKYWGRRMHGPSPTSNFGEGPSHIPPRSPPVRPTNIFTPRDTEEVILEAACRPHQLTQIHCRLIRAGLVLTCSDPQNAQ